MSIKDTKGKIVNEDNIPSITGADGISVSETATAVTLSVDIPSLTADSAPDVNADYIVFHDSVTSARKKILLAYLENLGNLSCKVDVYAAPVKEHGVEWYKPANAKLIAISLWGAGGGGGGGTLGAPSTDRAGGGGGGGGQWNTYIFPTEIVRDVGYIVVGKGGRGAAATRAPSEIGRDGEAGTGSYASILTNNLYLSALGGGAGLGGTITGNAGGAAGGTGAGAGGSGDDAVPSGTAGGDATIGGAGGGAGGGFDTTSNVAVAGSAGGIVYSTVMTAAAAGTAGGGAGGAGTDGFGTGGGGGGGGGGSSDVNVNGGDGGDGGWPGGGGGGGGSATSGNNAVTGRGGYGGDGLIIITSFF